MLTLEILNAIEQLLLSDRMTVRGNEVQGFANLISVLAQEKALVAGILRTQAATDEK